MSPHNVGAGKWWLALLTCRGCGWLRMDAGGRGWSRMIADGCVWMRIDADRGGD